MCIDKASHHRNQNHPIIYIPISFDLKTPSANKTNYRTRNFKKQEQRMSFENWQTRKRIQGNHKHIYDTDHYTTIHTHTHTHTIGLKPQMIFMISIRISSAISLKRSTHINTHTHALDCHMRKTHIRRNSILYIHKPQVFVRHYF